MDSDLVSRNEQEEWGLEVMAADRLHADEARRLAQRLGAPWRLAAAREDEGGRVTLIVEASGLKLRLEGSSDVSVDVLALGRPRRGRDLLSRALGGPKAKVVDATAGLGADAFQLATAGHEVTMIERVPVIALLLEEALERSKNGQVGAAGVAAAARLKLVNADARSYLTELPMGSAPDAILLDPMYPRRDKAALPAKGMALFRRLVGEDSDAAELLTVARSVALRRVVVKRPLRSPPLGDVEPSGSIKGSTTRYDLYAATGAASKLD